MILPLHTSYLQYGELADTTQAYLQKVSETDPTVPFLQKITDLLEDDLVTLQEALTAVRINRLIQAVSEADALRDDLFIAFKEMLRALQRRPEAPYREGYQALWPLLEQAGLQLYILGYAEQSGRMEALLGALDEDVNQTHLANMGLTDLYNSLKQSQENFSELYEQRLDVDSQKDFPTLSDAKRKLVPHLNMLLNAVQLLFESEPETYESLVQELNAITSHIMASARARRTRDERALAGELVLQGDGTDDTFNP